MSQFTELKEKFFSETGICAVNSQGEPDIDYVNWLESLVENGSSHNTASTKLPADIKEKFRRWCDEQTSFPREFVQIVNDHFWDLI